MEITKKEFEAFEKVRESGKTNMRDVKRVSALSHFQISEDKVKSILKDYDSGVEE